MPILLQVVKVHDGIGGVFKVALNSALEFGVMYDPNNDKEEALVRNNYCSLNLLSYNNAHFCALINNKPIE